MPFDGILEQGSSEDIERRELLANENWYHGPISRKDSEALVVNDGDFLVRESQGSSGQYVLTGMQGGVRKHLLLVDPEGVVGFSSLIVCTPVNTCFFDRFELRTKLLKV